MWNPRRHEGAAAPRAALHSPTATASVRVCLPAHIPSLEQRWIQRVVKPLRFLSLSPLFSFLLSVFYSFPFGSCGLMLP